MSGNDGDVQLLLPTRESKIPKDVEKVTPASDINPPKSESDLYFDPVPVEGLVNTAGGEDSPFISSDGKTLYLFFTPDVRVPAEKQIIDQVTGIYVSKKVGDTWQEPERVILQDSGKLALDGGLMSMVISCISAVPGRASLGYTGLRQNTWTGSGAAGSTRTRS
ncbi:MAG: hypothetical protein NTY03_04165 [Candidatus Bathyarchaeota archaeon]|nr:hypothetical protein [Candidatus Bathyarchaeota archaeon]